MATIGEITQGASYRGDSALGGRFSQGVTIDTTPLARLATFTYYRDKDLWEKKQQDDAMAAKQIADIAAYDVTSPFKQYTEDLTKEVTQLQEDVRKDPSIVTYDPKNPQKYIDYKERVGRIENKRKHATINDVLYNAAKSKAELIQDPAKRDRALRRLDIKAKTLFDEGVESAYGKQFETSPPPKPDQSIIPTAKSTTRSILVSLPNSDVVNEITYTDPEDLKANSILRATGMDSEGIKNQEWFKKLSPEEQAIELEESGSEELKGLENVSLTVNGLFSEWQTKNPGVDLNNVPDSELPKNSWGANVISARAINKSIDELNQLVAQGKIKDASGAVRTKDYSESKIDISNGLDASELIYMQSIQASKVPLIQKVEKKVQQNDNAIQKDQQNIGWYNARTGRIQEDRLAKAAGVPGQVASSAKSYAEGLMNKLNSLKDAGGVIGKDKLSKLTADELKYLGKGETTENKFTLTPLSLKTISSIVIDNDGNVLTYSGGTSKSLGTQAGPSINISTVATNKLGDEMVTSTGKEGFNFNNLIPLYNQQEGQPAPTPTTTAPASTPAAIKPLKATGQYIMVVEKNGVRYGKKKDGTIEIIK